MLTVLRKYRQLTFDNYHIQHLSIGERCIWYFFIYTILMVLHAQWAPIIFAPSNN